MQREKIISGCKRPGDNYKDAAYRDLAGKTIEAVGSCYVDGAYGLEPATMLYFTDGTRHLFVHPNHEDDL